MDLRSSVAAVRFGLGRRPEDAIPADPVAWLERQISRPAPQRALPGLAPPLTLSEAGAMYERRATRERGDTTILREIARAPMPTPSPGWAIAWFPTRPSRTG